MAVRVFSDHPPPKAGAGKALAHDQEEQYSQMERWGMKGGFTFCINNPNPPQAFYPSQKGGLIESTEKAQTQASGSQPHPTDPALPPC